MSCIITHRGQIIFSILSHVPSTTIKQQLKNGLIKMQGNYFKLFNKKRQTYQKEKL